MNNKFYIAIILASGSGSRFENDTPKQFLKINDKTILQYSIEAFQNNSGIDEIIIVTNPLFIERTENIVKLNNYNKVKKIVAGGKTRQESSFIGVHSVDYENAKVLIHDAARPLVSQKIINECINSLDKYNAVNVAIKTTDTILKIDKDNFISEIPDRNFLMRCQTPQAFDLKLIQQAHNLAKKSNITFTDDCGIIVNFNLAKVFVVEGDENNIKITYPNDFNMAKKIILS